MRICCLLVVISAVTFANDYHGESVMRTFPRNEYEAELVRKKLSELQVDVWRDTGLPDQPIDFRVPHSEVGNWLGTLTSEAIRTELHIKDIQDLIDAEHVIADPAIREDYPYDIDPTQYHTLDEIHAWLDDIASRCGSSCQIITFGDSYEGRDLKVIRIGQGGSSRRKVWIDGGIHAREWISPAVANYIIGRLVLDADQPEVAALREAFDWYIMPVLNPDGYDYTWTTDRMWRKSRSPNAGSSCVGTDMNRNFDHMWSLAGSSADPCSSTHHGPGPASEQEISALQDNLLAMLNIELLVSLHSYGQVLIYPWGYTTDVDPPNYPDIVALAGIGVEAINAVHDMGYEHRRPGAHSGNTMDWARGVADIPYAYILELRDKGEFGFVLPPQQILPCAEETWAGVVAMATEII